MKLRPLYILNATVTFLTCVFASAEGFAASGSGVWMCKELAREEVVPKPDLAERLEKNIALAATALASGDSATLHALSEQFLEDAISFHRSIGSSIVIDPLRRWMDVLPDAQGGRLNQLSVELEQKSFVKAILRYEPSVLFQNANRALDRRIRGKSRAISLSHRDVFGWGVSDYLKKQLLLQDTLNEARMASVSRGSGKGLTSREALVTEKDHSRDWFADLDPENAPAKTTEVTRLLESYLSRSKVSAMVTDPNDPIAVRFSPGSYLFGSGIRDSRGFSHRVRRIGDSISMTYTGNRVDQERTLFDLFLSFNHSLEKADGALNRALILEGGRTLAMVDGRSDSSKYFEAYLQFLGSIYKDPKGLAISDKKFQDLERASLSFRNRSKLVVWADDPNWFRSPSEARLTGGMILVESREVGELLPMEVANPGLRIARNPDEILIEMGRLGSLTPYATIEFLKVAGADLATRYPLKKIRVVCEADGSRAAYFGRFGFKPSDVKIQASGYYPSGTDQVLEVDLEGFLKAVLR